MNKSILRITVVAVAFSLAPAVQAGDIARDTGVGEVIAAQGNAALRAVREELKFPVRVVKPTPPPVRPPVTVQVVDGQGSRGTKARA